MQLRTSHYNTQWLSVQVVSSLDGFLELPSCVYIVMCIYMYMYIYGIH